MEEFLIRYDCVIKGNLILSENKRVKAACFIAKIEYPYPFSDPKGGTFDIYGFLFSTEHHDDSEAVYGHGISCVRCRCRWSSWNRG